MNNPTLFIEAFKQTLTSQTFLLFPAGLFHPAAGEDVPAGPGPHPLRPDRGAHPEEQPGGDGPPDGRLRRRPIRGGGGAGGVDIQRETGSNKINNLCGKYVA